MSDMDKRLTELLQSIDLAFEKNRKIKTNIKAPLFNSKEPFTGSYNLRGAIIEVSDDEFITVEPPTENDSKADVEVVFS